MINQQHTYRGVAYAPKEHEKASSAFVEHIYRGKRYQAPLRHESTDQDENIELHYRGSVYKHRKEMAHKAVNN